MPNRRVLTTTFVSLIAIQSCRASLLFEGIAASSPLNPGALLTSDTSSQLTSLIGNPSDLMDLSGLAFSFSGILYGVQTLGSASSIGRLDPGTGALLSPLVAIHDSGGAGNLAMDDITFQPTTNLLYGITAPSNPEGGGLLYRIDPGTGAASLVGDTTSGSGGGLAFGLDGTLYFAANNLAGFSFLLNLDPSNANVQSSVELTQPYVALAVDPSSGQLIGAASGFDGIWSIDPTLGFETLDFLTTQGNPGSLTFAADTPEPGTFGFAALGLLLVCPTLHRALRRKATNSRKKA